jgi:hypothetical protein
MTLATSCLVANLQIGVAAGAPKEIVAAGAKVRYHFYVNTLAWKGNGDRLLPCKNVMAFMGGHLALKKEFAERIMIVGDAMDKFYVRLDTDVAVEPSLEHPALDLPVGLAVKVRSLMSKAHDQRVARATEDLWSRLVGPLTHFASTMASDKAFRDATIKNLVDAVELLPRLNFADHGGLIEVLERVDRMVAFFPIKDLRKQDGVRAAAERDARKILAEIERIRG